jgi:hypothetical protein
MTLHLMTRPTEAQAYRFTDDAAAQEYAEKVEAMLADHNPLDYWTAIREQWDGSAIIVLYCGDEDEPLAYLGK